MENATKALIPEPATAARRKNGRGRSAELDLGVLNDHLGFFLRLLQIEIFRDLTAKLSEFDLRPGQYSVFLLVAANPGRKQAEIGATLNIERAGVAKILNDLEGRGWIRRQASDADGRSNNVYITPAGEAALAEVSALANEFEGELSARIGEQRHSQLLSLAREIY